MAFNRRTFWQRTISGIIFVAVMLGGLLWNQWSFLALFTIIHFGCWWEYLKIIEKIHTTVFHPYIKLGFMVIGFGLLLWFCGSSYTVRGYGMRENLSLPVSAAGFALLMIGIFQKGKINFKAFGAAALGWLYLSLNLGLMIDLNGSVYDVHIHDTMYVVGGYFFTIIIIAGMWMIDTMAYLVGSWIGKTPFSKISPKKTWEGTIGGIVLGVAINAFIFPLIFFSWDISLSLIIIPISFIAAVTGNIGDLFESWLKRKAGIKDSGFLMPGHGGYLDRFDSLLFAVPITWIFVNLLYR